MEKKNHKMSLKIIAAMKFNISPIANLDVLQMVTFNNLQNFIFAELLRFTAPNKSFVILTCCVDC